MNEFDDKCAQVLQGFDNELQKVRTGRAHPGLLDGVTVSAYGVPTPMKQAASVSIADARTLHVTPWDRGLLSAMSKAIQEADLGLNPTELADKLIVPMPLLTEERRKDLIKLVKQEGERCKISLRHHRREELTAAKNAVKQKDMTEDEEKRHEQEVDKVIERYSKIVDANMASKEKELLAV